MLILARERQSSTQTCAMQQKWGLQPRESKWKKNLVDTWDWGWWRCGDKEIIWAPISLGMAWGQFGHLPGFLVIPGAAGQAVLCTSSPIELCSVLTFWGEECSHKLFLEIPSEPGRWQVFDPSVHCRVCKRSVLIFYMTSSSVMICWNIQVLSCGCKG